MPDYRADRMASPEGHGNARQAWEEVTGRLAGAARSPVTERLVENARSPVLKPLARRFAAPLAVDIAGFWLLWHLEGGFEGLRQLGMSRASIYRRIRDFRDQMGVHPDEYAMPGVALDLEKYLTTPGEPTAES